jgi:hypothetical protein
VGQLGSCGPGWVSKAFFFEKKKQKTFAPLSRACWIGVCFVAGGCLLGDLAVAAPPSGKPALVKTKSSAFDVVPWSLTPALGSTEARLGMRAERQDSDPAPGAETIVVFGRRMRKAPVESDLVRRDEPGAEAWQSDAAQSYVPGMGDTCTYKSGCFDKDQPGLFSTIPALFGSH